MFDIEPFGDDMSEGWGGDISECWVGTTIGDGGSLGISVG